MGRSSLTTFFIALFALCLSTVADTAFGAALIREDMLIKRYGLKREIAPATGRRTYRAKGIMLEVLPRSVHYRLNQRALTLSQPLSFDGGHLVFPDDIVKVLRKVAPTQPDSSLKQRPLVVCLDAGHGGKDPGAVGKHPGFTVFEKDVTLDVVKRVGKHLKGKSGISVVYTRTTDKFLELSQRPRFANQAGADFFISIHANAARSRSATGIETFYITPETSDRKRSHLMAEKFDAKKRFPNEVSKLTSWQEKHLYHAMAGHNRIEAKRFANAIQAQMVSGVKAVNRKVKDDNFHVLRMASCPAVLIETGFLSNKGEATKLNSPAHREKLAKIIAKAIISQLK